MKKKYITAAFAAALSIGAMAQTLVVTPKSGQAVRFKIAEIESLTFEEEVDLTDATLLSEGETANCYIVKPGSKVAFSVAVKGNSDRVSAMWPTSALCGRMPTDL